MARQFRVLCFLALLTCAAQAQDDWLFYDSLIFDREQALAAVPELFTHVEGAPLVSGGERYIPLDGRYTLAAPTAERMIRLRMHIVDRLRIDIPGQPGLRIEMQPTRNLSVRQATWPGPELGIKIGDDGHIWVKRLTAGVLDLRLQDGAFVLAQGDVIVLNLPLSGQPEQLDIDLKAKLYAANRLPCKPLPQFDLSALLDTPRVLTPSWTLSEDKDGTIEQAAKGITLTRREGQSRLSARAEFANLHDGVLTFSVRASVGAGVYLRRPDDPTLLRLAVGEHKGDRVLCENPANTGHVESLHASGQIVGERFWVRAILATNHVLLQASHDGIHWYEMVMDSIKSEQKIEGLELGLTVANGMQGTVTIEPPTFASWKGAIEALGPALEVDAEHFAHPQVGYRTQRLFYGVLDAIKKGVDPDLVFPAVRELPWRITPWKDQVSSDGVWWGLWELYQRFGDRLSATGQGHRLGELLDAWPRHQPCIMRFVRGIRRAPESVNERHLYHLWQSEDWDALLQQSRRVAFNHLSGSESASSHHRHTFDRRIAWWMGLEAQARLSGRQSRHPLQVGRDREFDNTYGELTTALETNEIPRAARLLSQTDMPDLLVPSVDDPDRFVRASARFREVIAGSPALQDELVTRYESVGRLRLAQAREFGNVDQLRHLRTYFHGTQVARDATLDLANRDLSLGNFSAAAETYRQLPQPPADKLALIKSLQTETSQAEPALAPVSGDFDIQIIQGLRLPRRALEHRHDETVGRVGFAKSANRLFVHHSCLLFAVEGDRVVWQRPRPKLPRHLPHPATPILVDDMVIVPEHDPDKGWTLIACAQSDGALRWQEQLHGELIAGPIVTGDGLSIALLQDDRGRRQVAVQSVDPRRGTLRESIPVASFQQDERLYHDSALTVWRDRLILRAGNAIFAIDGDGPVWARRLLCMPIDHVRAPGVHGWQPPLVSGDRLICRALGSGGVYALDPATGKLLWRHVEPTCRNLLRLDEERLGVFSEHSFTVLNAATGEPLSYRYEYIILRALMPAANGDIAMIHFSKVHNDWEAKQRRIRWFDPATGEERAHQWIGGSRQIYDLRGLWSDGRDLYGFAVNQGGRKEDPIQFLRLKAR